MKEKVKLKRVGLIVFLCLESWFGMAQGSFSFLNLPFYARTSALGGTNISIITPYLPTSLQNPAVLDSSHQNQIGISYSPYLAQTHLLSACYSPHWKSNWAVSLQNLNYGNFQGTDVWGNQTGNFSANDFSLGVAHSRKIQHISFGIQAKIVGSLLESYRSLALATDWGGTFIHPSKNITFGLLVKNVGFILKRYSAQNISLPFDLQLGTTFKPQYMPIRFSITAHHLYQFDIVTNNPNYLFSYDNQGNKILKKASFADKLARHFIVGTEIFIHPRLQFLLGYNHLVRKEMQLSKISSLAGFSGGISLKTKALQLSFAQQWLTPHISHSTFSLDWRFMKR